MRWIFVLTIFFAFTSCLPTYDDSYDDRDIMERYRERDYERGAFDRSMFEEGAGFRD